MFDLEFENKMEEFDAYIRTQIVMAEIEKDKQKDIRIIMTLESLHAVAVLAMITMPIVCKNKKKAEKLLQVAVDLFAVRIGTGLDEMREKLPIDIREYVPKATRTQTEMLEIVKELEKNYG